MLGQSIVKQSNTNQLCWHLVWNSFEHKGFTFSGESFRLTWKESGEHPSLCFAGHYKVLAMWKVLVNQMWKAMTNVRNGNIHNEDCQVQYANDAGTISLLTYYALAWIPVKTRRRKKQKATQSQMECFNQSFTEISDTMTCTSTCLLSGNSFICIKETNMNMNSDLLGIIAELLELFSTHWWNVRLISEPCL